MDIRAGHGLSAVSKLSKFLSLLISLPLFFASSAGHPEVALGEARGLWVECEGSQETLFSREKIDRMISRAAASGFNLLLIQIYRHDRAWFNSLLADTTPYRRIVKKEKIDPLGYIIAKAHRAGLEVHAWMNMFRIGKDRRAPVLRRLGDGVVTRDGRGRSLLSYPEKSLPDGGYWLEPGDKNVRKYLLDIIGEVIRKYPDLDGIHLDFVRYPYSAPHGGSLWAGKKDFGYGRESVARFKKWTGLDPLKMEFNRSNCQAWDNWRRYQINSFISEVYGFAHQLRPALKVSAAVIAWADRAYLSAFQDWRRWLEEGTVDFAAPMNYSTDPRLSGYLTRSAVAFRKRRQVYIGLGAYLLLDNQPVLFQEIAACRAAGASGILFFSYDALCRKPEILRSIKNKFFSPPASVPPMPWKK